MRARRSPARMFTDAGTGDPAARGCRNGPHHRAKCRGRATEQNFTDAEIAIGKAADAQRTKAYALFAQWKTAHGTIRDDKTLTAWAAMQVPVPPSAKERTAELHQDQALAKTRPAAGKEAATWLELHGKKDAWKLYLHDQCELIATTRGTAEKAGLKAALNLAKTISDQLAATVVAWTVDVRVKRPDGADYDAPRLASAVRASPRSQAWAWSVS